MKNAETNSLRKSELIACPSDAILPTRQGKLFLFTERARQLVRRCCSRQLHVHPRTYGPHSTRLRGKIEPPLHWDRRRTCRGAARNQRNPLPATCLGPY